MRNTKLSGIICHSLTQLTYEGGVSCGGESSSCQTTYEGGVSCGGKSSSCQTTYEGGVACGGLAKKCEISPKGTAQNMSVYKSREFLHGFMHCDIIDDFPEKVILLLDLVFQPSV